MANQRTDWVRVELEPVSRSGGGQGSIDVAKCPRCGTEILLQHWEGISAVILAPCQRQLAFQAETYSHAYLAVGNPYAVDDDAKKE